MSLTQSPVAYASAFSGKFLRPMERRRCEAEPLDAVDQRRNTGKQEQCNLRLDRREGAGG